MILRASLITAMVALPVWYALNSQPRLSVIDGDTIVLAGERLRLAHHDAPEIFSPHCPSELSLGYKATRRLRDLLAEGFSYAYVTCANGRPRDAYGRRCVVVTVKDRSGLQEDVGSVMIREGLAVRFGNGRPDWCSKGGRL